ncbi:uncharacterized protein LOC119184697 isoform X2 [Rhipicephalus microplus]|uniref:uncharacterized protein LOC119184697 isoform X2 n=1 Tax=Rhipicephalus microplus TaxID=6941 RepID=UPI003F6D0F94
MVFVCCKAIQPHVVLGACYRPPDSDSTFIPMFHDALQSLKIHFPNAPVVLFGDFNFPNIDWSDLVLVTSKQNIENNFVDTCLTFALTQIVNAATRQSKHSANILDLVLTTLPDRITSLSYLDEISDHKVIHGTFHCRLKRPDKTRKKLTLYDKGDYNNFNKELTKFCQFVVKDFNKRSVTENWLMFKSKMHELISTYIPTITIGERSTSRWFNPELKRLKNKKKRQFRAAKNSNNPVAWQKYQTTTKLFCSAIDKAKRLFNNTTLPNLLRTNPKQFWRVINPRNENKCISIMDPTGQPIANNAVAEELNHTFSSVFTREPIENLPDVSPHNYPTMPDVIFSPQGIQKIIESLKLTSSCGIDGINAKVLKNTKEITSVILSYIFQQSLSSGIVPHDWKTFCEYYMPMFNHTGFMPAVAMVRPKSRGTVKLNFTHPNEMPLIDPQFLSEDEDVERIVNGTIKIMKLFNTSAMQAIGAKIWDGFYPYCKNYTIWSKEYIDCFVRQAAFPGQHVCCTCAMGEHNRSVVDSRLKVRGLQNVRVIDASVMPQITSGNINAAVLMIGDRGAKMIIEDHNHTIEAIRVKKEAAI